jgi:hypothetical protein
MVVLMRADVRRDREAGKPGGETELPPNRLADVTVVQV